MSEEQEGTTATTDDLALPVQLEKLQARLERTLLAHEAAREAWSANQTRLRAARDAAMLAERATARQLDALHDSLAVSMARVEAAERDRARLQDELSVWRKSVRKGLHEARVTTAGPSGQTGSPGGPDLGSWGQSGSIADLRFDIPAGMVLSWMRALPFAKDEIARIWGDLAIRIRTDHPAQALALLRIAQTLHPSDRTAGPLGLALIEAGEGTAGQALIAGMGTAPVLSSRESRLLELVRAGHEGPDLRARAARAVDCPLRVAGWLEPPTRETYAPACDLLDMAELDGISGLDRFRPQLLLVEASRADAAGSQLHAALDWCRARGVPSAIWFSHAPLLVHAGAVLARPFGLAFVADPALLAALRRALGHDRVHLLPFACQPALDNPLCRKAGTLHVERWGQGADPRDEQLFAGFFAAVTQAGPAGDPTFGVVFDTARDHHAMVVPGVHALLARGLRPVLQDAPATRRMFGDLVVSTMIGDEAAARLREDRRTGCGARIRLAGLRKVLSEHTARHRVAELAARAGIALPAPVRPQVTMLAQASDAAELATLRATFAGQMLPDARMVVVLNEGVAAPAENLPQALRLIPRTYANSLRLGDLVGTDGWVAGVLARDHHGPQYLTDLMLATGWSDAEVIGKAARFRADATGLHRLEGPVHEAVPELPLRGALIRAGIVAEAGLTDWLDDLPQASHRAGWEGADLAVDPFGYCEDGATGLVPRAEVAAAVDDLPDLDTGADLAQIAEEAMTGQPWLPPRPPWISGAAFSADIPPSRLGKVSWSAEGQDLVVVSRRDTDKPVYFYETRGRPIEDFARSGEHPIHLQVTPGLRLTFVAVFHDRAMERLAHQMLTPNRSLSLDPPAGTAVVRLGVRIAGAGSCRVRRIVLGELAQSRLPGAIPEAQGTLCLHIAQPPAGTRIAHNIDTVPMPVPTRIVGILGAELRARLGVSQGTLPFDRYDLGWDLARPRYLVIDADALAETPGWEHALTLRDPPATVELAVMLQKARAAGIATVLVPPSRPHRTPLLSRVAGLFDLTWSRGGDLPEASHDLAGRGRLRPRATGGPVAMRP